MNQKDFSLLATTQLVYSLQINYLHYSRTYVETLSGISKWKDSTYIFFLVVCYATLHPLSTHGSVGLWACSLLGSGDGFKLLLRPKSQPQGQNPSHKAHLEAQILTQDPNSNPMISLPATKLITKNSGLRALAGLIS